MITSDAKEIKTDSNIQNVIFLPQNDVKTAERALIVPESP